MWVTDDECQDCGHPGAIEKPYRICPKCWAKANYVHVRDRARMAAEELTPKGD